MSGIAIKINAGSTQETSSVHATGSLRHIVTDEERATFGILDDDLKIKVRAVLGREPNGIWIRSLPQSTLCGDLYKRHGWDQVETVLTPIKTKILSVETVPTILSKIDLKNESSQKGTFTGKLSTLVSTTVGTSWSLSRTLSFNQEISYGVKVMGVGIDGNTSFGFQGQWGKNGEESRAMTFGTEAGASMELEPCKAVVAELSANSGKMKVRVTYEARLTGDTAIDYNSAYEGHHHYGIPILMFGGTFNSVEVTEDIEIGFYSDGRVTVKDLAGETLKCERVPCSLCL